MTELQFIEANRFLWESAPYRAMAYHFWSTFFLGRGTPEWRAQSQDVARVTAALWGEEPSEDPFAKVDQQTLARAFATLFYGVGIETIPLTKSAWTGADGLTAGRASDRARAIYRAHGLEVCEGEEHLPEDHLGIVLGFLGDLAQMTAQKNEPAKGNQGEQDDENLFAAAKLLAHEREFLQEYVLTWWKGAYAAIKERRDAEPVLAVFEAFDRYLRGVELIFSEADGTQPPPQASDGVQS